jgi:tetratricopeptide (TPR) repeat protein
MLLSQTYYRAGQLQQALDAANKATAIDPKDVRGWQLAMVAAKDMNLPDSVLAIGQRALAAGADKAQIGPMMLAPVSAAVKKAQELKTRDSWKAALAAAEMVDGIAPTPEAKFYIGVSAFQVAVDLMTEVQTLTKSTKAADKAQACALSKEGEDYLTKVSVAMPQGGKVDAQVAGQILGNVGNYTEFIGQVKKAFCK